MKDVVSFVIVYSLLATIFVGFMWFIGAPSWFDSSSSDQECYIEYGGGIGGSSEIICY